MRRRSFLWSSLLFVAGCTAATRKRKTETLNLAVAEIQGLEKLKEEYEPFRAALETVLENKIDFLPVESFTEASAALQYGRVNLVWAGPSTYVVIRARTNAIPLVALTRPNYYSVIVVHADSGIQSVSELKGKKMIVGKQGSTSAHICPNKLLLDIGLNPLTDLDITVFNGDKDETWYKFKNKEFDAWGGVIHRYERLLAADGDSTEAFSVIGKGEPLPNDVFIANSELDVSLVASIRDRMLNNQEQLMRAILSTESNKKFEGGQLISARDCDYDIIREVYKAIDQDIFIESRLGRDLISVC